MDIQNGAKVTVSDDSQKHADDQLWKGFYYVGPDPTDHEINFHVVVKPGCDPEFCLFVHEVDEEMTRLEDEMFYPEALSWVWHNCVFLGKYEWEDRQYDLGAYCTGDKSVVDAAIVCSNKPGDYLAGDRNTCENADPVYQETFRRWDAYVAGTPIQEVRTGNWQ